ncbi:uncharacterized protein TNCV_4016171 [Trichonephila clavipes]|nr:uncharacterized protein TNCV_4016171 [Trichonephila clavipes]
MVSSHTNMIVITAEIESGFVANDDMVPFRCCPDSSCVALLQTEAPMSSSAAHVMGTAFRNVFQPGAFVWFAKTQKPLVKVLSVLGWWTKKQLAERVHFLRCGSLLDDWSSCK